MELIFKKGDKVKYLGMEAIITNVQTCFLTDKNLYDLKYKTVKGCRKVKSTRSKDCITK
jgi:hypothetical protein